MKLNGIKIVSLKFIKLIHFEIQFAEKSR